MPKEYEDLSRRGIIKLNKDFDAANNNMLHNFLGENQNYEKIRPIESFTEKTDVIIGKASGVLGVIKKATVKEIDKLLDKAVDGITNLITK